MACTLEELQKTEYEILCQFADFCDTHRIMYVLSGGTLLGAVRHDGFIPWDDDVDIDIEVHEFRKFLRYYRKHPIPGLHLSWMNSEPENPIFFAKLRKNGTFMPETYQFLKDIDIHNGIWIDIFCYCGVPKNKRLAALQDKLCFYYHSLSHLIFFKHDPDIEHPLTKTKAYSIAMKLPKKTVFHLRKLLFWLYTNMGSSRSKEVLFCGSPNLRLPRKNYTPVCQHVFCDRKFSIPQNYDKALTDLYGDYMTPVQFPSHTNLESIHL